MKSQQIRQSFRLFKDKGHSVANSAPIIIKNDPANVYQCWHESI